MKDSKDRFLQKNNIKEKNEMNLEGKLTAYVKLITLNFFFFLQTEKRN